MGKEHTYDFYADPDTDQSVFAVSGEMERPDGMVEGFAAVHDRPNSSVSWTTIHPSLLGDQLSEDKARERHPRLFERLDKERLDKEES